MPATRQLQLHEATIGVVTAIPREYAAVKCVLDCQPEVSAPGTGAGRSVALASIRANDGGVHVVAVQISPDTGNNLAVACAISLLRNCTNVRHIIMSGIAGAVPYPQNAEHHVRLGDLVVSSRHGVIQYDFQKVTAELANNSRWTLGSAFRRTWNLVRGRPNNQFYDRVEVRNPPRPPSAEMLQAVQRLEAGVERNFRPWEKIVDECIQELGDDWRRPLTSFDRLSDWGVEAEHPHDSRRHSSDYPRVFLGPIGSANILLKNPRIREQLRCQFGIKAVEMEGSGIADATWHENVDYMVVRGTCDYCNRDKGDTWQKYAALIAAAYTRILIEALPSSTPPLLPSSSSFGDAISRECGNSDRPSFTWPRSTLQMPIGESPSPNFNVPTAWPNRIEKSSLRSDDNIPDYPITAPGPTLNPVGELASLKIANLLDTIDTLLSVFDSEKAQALAPELERAITEGRSYAHKTLIAKAYHKLAELALQHAKNNRRSDGSVDTSQAQSFYQEAQRVLSE